MSNQTKHAVDTTALQTLIDAFRTSSDLPSKEVNKIIQTVVDGAQLVTINPPKEESVVSENQSAS